jgi:hypothetical protein
MREKMKRTSAFIRLLACTMIMYLGVAMADDKMGFGYNGYNMSNAESNFGINGDKFSLIMRGATSHGSMRGVGVFEGKLSSSDRAKASELRRNVCSLKGGSSLAPGNNAFLYPSVLCDDGRWINAAIDLAALGSGAGNLITPTEELIESFFNSGEKLAKLDVTSDVMAENGKLLITLKFSNAGRSEIAFKSPSTWEGTYNPLAGNSIAYVSAGPQDAGFDMDFGGREMINKADYPDNVVRISPGQFRYAKFAVYPNNRIKAGRYEVGGGATIKEVLAPKELAGRVDFLFQRTTVQFATDYPANQKELGEFEAYRRTQLFGDIHGIGDAVKEAGYYRAFGENGERDDFPQRFATGDKFPTRQMEQQRAKGRIPVGPAVIWRWEAYPDAQITARSLERCPRSGFWLPAIPTTGLSEYATHLFHSTHVAHSVAADNPMPVLGLGDREREAQVVWTWIGTETS